MKWYKTWIYGSILVLSMILLVVLNLWMGAVYIPFKDILEILSMPFHTNNSFSFIILQLRLPQAITALFCGAALSVSGLMLQTAFHNALAGPSIFGISSGAGLGVAIVMLCLGGSLSTVIFTVSGFLAVLIAAFVGAMLVTGIILLCSHWVKSDVMLLIVGIMIGYLSSSAIVLINFFATQEGVKSYMMWGMGNFGSVSLQLLPLFVILIIIGLFCATLLVKPLNALLLGENYARNLGINVQRVRNYLLIVTGLLTAVCTAFCGPIGFIGLIVPHIARLIIQTDNHRQLLLFTMLMGAIIVLVCNLICVLFGEQGTLPLNAITPIIGVPVVIYIIWNGRS